MGIIMKNGIVYGGSGGGTAESTTYDNSASGLEAENVQDAVDELKNYVEEVISVNLAEVASLLGGDA